MKIHTQKIHFIGIGGIGVSALARWFLAQGWSVSGSDLSLSSTIEELRKEGIPIQIGHKKSNLPKDLDMVVYSNAISPGSSGYVEIKEAERLGIRPMSYPRTLGCLTEVYRTIAIAGSHGKSTTTALIGLALKDTHLFPTIVIGTKLKELANKNFHQGKSHIGEPGWLVLEADEWRGAFLHYHPDIAVVTNIDKEHLDFYKDLEDVQDHFIRFLNRVKPGGSFVLNKDDSNLRALSSRIQKIADAHSISVFWYSLEEDALTISKIKKALQIPGIHNLSNALAAYTVASQILTIPKKQVLVSLGGYQGAWRRMEYRGHLRIKDKTFPVDVYDDYAHHPSEITATLQAFREKFPKKKIICVFQPHQAKRLKALYSEFLQAFNGADILLLLPTYEVAGRDFHEKKYTSKRLAQDISHTHNSPAVLFVSNFDQLCKEILKIVSDDSVLVMMGAGNIITYTDQLIENV